MPLPRRYATLDPAVIGPALELQDGGVIVTYDTDGATLSRHVRSTQGLSAGRHRWEVIVYGDGSLDQAATTAAIGLVQQGTDTNTFPGEALNTVGYRPGDGGCWQNSSAIATVATAPLRSVIVCALDLVSSPTLSIYVNRLLVHTFTLPAGATWFPAVAVGGETAYAFSAYVNLGLRAFEEASIDGFRDGVYTSPQPLPTLRLASDDWMSAPTAALPNVAYAGDVINGRNFAIERSVMFWPWGREGGSTGYADLDIDNRGGAYTRLLGGTARNVRVVLKLADRDAPDAAPALLATTYLAKSELVTMQRGKLRLRDGLEQLRSPAQRRYFLPYTPEGTRGRPWPISYGAARSVEGILVDELRRSYVFADRALTQIGTVREKGDRLDPMSGPPDYSTRSDLRGIELNEEPLGKLVADISSSGEPMIVGAPDVDVLDGYGAMTNAASGMPEQWTASGLMFRTAASRVATGGGRLRTTTNGILPSAIDALWDVRFRDLRTEAVDWLPIRKGCYYRLRWKVQSAYWPTTMGFGQFSGGWQIRGAGQVGIAGGMTTQFVPGEYTLDFRAECDGTLSWFGFGNIDPANNGGSTGPWWVEIDDVECVLKSAATPDVYQGTGNFVGSIPSWWKSGSAVGATVTHGTIVSPEYPAPGIGCMQFSITAGVGNYGARSCNLAPLWPGVPHRLAFSMAETSGNGRLQIYAWDTNTDEQFLLDSFVGPQGLCECTITVGTECLLYLRADTVDFSTGVVKVSQLRLLDLTDQVSESATSVPLTGITLHDFCKDVIETRAGLGPGAWAPGDALAIDAATGYVFGVHSREQVTNEALLRTPLDSFTAGITTDENDRIRVPRLIDPETVPDENLAFDIVVGVDTRGELSYVVDMAPGLTAHAGCRRNWTLHTDSDFVEDFDPETGISAAARTQLKRKFQQLVSSTKPLHPLYDHARDAGPLETVLDVKAHALAALEHALDFYAVVRGFYTVDVMFAGSPPPIRPGVVGRLTWTDHGITHVRKVYVKRTRCLATSGVLTIEGWGKGLDVD